MTTAYDYEKQEWVTGDAAKAALEWQRQETLAVIDDPGYQRMMGYTAAQAAEIKATLKSQKPGSRPTF
jgi:hypothetical protein